MPRIESDIVAHVTDEEHPYLFLIRMDKVFLLGGSLRLVKGVNFVDRLKRLLLESFRRGLLCLREGLR